MGGVGVVLLGRRREEREVESRVRVRGEIKEREFIYGKEIWARAGWAELL